jgi:hypothetical protein
MGAGADEMARYRAVLRSATIKQNIAYAGVPGVQQVWCHEIGGARLLHDVAIKQRYPGHAVQAGHVAAQCGASAYASKYVGEIAPGKRADLVRVYTACGVPTARTVWREGHRVA